MEAASYKNVFKFLAKQPAKTIARILNNRALRGVYVLRFNFSARDSIAYVCLSVTRVDQ